MPNKILKIEVIDPDYKESEHTIYGSNGNIPIIYKHECPHIINRPSEALHSLDGSINKIIECFVDRKINTMIIDIAERNYHYSPAKEMTIKEVEEALGYKIKIVGELKNDA